MRGTLTKIEPFGAVCRFIPACAGNACRCPAASRSPAVHPRVCGERCRTSFQSHLPGGSSPRVRGTLLHRCEALTATRFIPACAGNAHPVPRWKSPVSVHPRVCGERRETGALKRLADGSSPRVRGTLKREHPALSTNRFIPACAGNAKARTSGFVDKPVHPRVCGEREIARVFWRNRTGSSPRVRGTQGLSHDFCSLSAVHPRVCGERVVGVPLDFPLRRFIPACAGNATCGMGLDYAVAVHPRVCGERAAMMSSACPRNGSSPRVRGTRGKWLIAKCY